MPQVRSRRPPASPIRASPCSSRCCRSIARGSGAASSGPRSPEPPPRPPRTAGSPRGRGRRRRGSPATQDARLVAGVVEVVALVDAAAPHAAGRCWPPGPGRPWCGNGRAGPEWEAVIRDPVRPPGENRQVVDDQRERRAHLVVGGVQPDSAEPCVGTTCPGRVSAAAAATVRSNRTWRSSRCCSPWPCGHHSAGWAPGAPARRGPLPR